MKVYKVNSGITLNEYAMSIYSRIGRHPRHFLPVFDKNEEYDLFFWTDDNIFSCPTFDEKNYGWLTESEAIVPNLYARFVGSLPDILNQFSAVFSHKRSLVDKHEKILWIPAGSTWIKNPQIHEKTKLVSMISSLKTMCAGHLKRIEYLRKFQNSLDLFGREFRPIGDKEEGLCDYMFSVAIENAEYSGYFTEKILDCFATGTIPVYLGDPDIDMVFNPDGIIKLDDNFDLSSLSAELYYEKMDAVIDNFNRVQDYLTIEDYIYKNYLENNAN